MLAGLTLHQYSHDWQRGKSNSTFVRVKSSRVDTQSCLIAMSGNRTLGRQNESPHPPQEISSLFQMNGGNNAAFSILFKPDRYLW